MFSHKPEGFHTLTPHLVVKGASEAIAFYAKVFHAVETSRMAANAMPPMEGDEGCASGVKLSPNDTRLMHASIMIGDSLIMLCDEFPEFGQAIRSDEKQDRISLHMYVDNVDEVFNAAITAGCTLIMPVGDMFWGDRYGKLRDPYGIEWSLATPIAKH